MDSNSDLREAIEILRQIHTGGTTLREIAERISSGQSVRIDKATIHRWLNSGPKKWSKYQNKTKRLIIEGAKHLRHSEHSEILKVAVVSGSIEATPMFILTEAEWATVSGVTVEIVGVPNLEFGMGLLETGEVDLAFDEKDSQFQRGNIRRLFQVFSTQISGMMPAEFLSEFPRQLASATVQNQMSLGILPNECYQEGFKQFLRKHNIPNCPRLIVVKDYDEAYQLFDAGEIFGFIGNEFVTLNLLRRIAHLETLKTMQQIPRLMDFVSLHAYTNAMTIRRSTSLLYAILCLCQRASSHLRPSGQTEEQEIAVVTKINKWLGVSRSDPKSGEHLLREYDFQLSDINLETIIDLWQND